MRSQYCPTSYNPVAPWGKDHLNDTLLPQQVWIDLPVNFTSAAARLNCHLPLQSAETATDAGLRQLLNLLLSRDGNSEEYSCAASVTELTHTFARVLNASNSLVADLAAGGQGEAAGTPEALSGLVHSSTVLRSFHSAPPPVGTQRGLHTMLQNARNDEFRRRALHLWDELLLR